MLIGMISIFILFRKSAPFKVKGTLLILLSFCLSYLLTQIMYGLAWRIGAVDHPSSRKMHKNDTPLLGGVAVFLAFSIGAVSMLEYSFELKGVVYAATVVFLLGLA